MAFNTVLLDKEDLNRLLSELADKLPDDQILKFGVCGGGALMYFYDIDYQTTDLDVFNISYGYGSLTKDILDNIKTIGKDNNIGPDWINDAVSLPDFQEKNIFTLKDMIRFLDIENSIWIYDSKGTPKINLVPVSFCGIIAAKLIAGRAKDIDTIRSIFKSFHIKNEETLNTLFANFPTFIGSDKYFHMIENANIIFEQLGGE